MKFSIKDLVILTEETLNGKLHFLCRDDINRTLPEFVMSSVASNIGWGVVSKNEKTGKKW